MGLTALVSLLLLSVWRVPVADSGSGVPDRPTEAARCFGCSEPERCGVHRGDTCNGRKPELGKLVAPYGGVKRCAASDCHGDNGDLDANGAYLFSNVETGKLSVLCGACCDYVELHNPLRFRRVML